MKSSFTESGVIEPNYTPDLAAEIDSPTQIIAQLFKEGGPGAVADWHHRELEEGAQAAVASQLARVVAFLIQPARNLHAKVWGLAFSCGLATRANGVVNITAQAKRDGCSRALISHYKRAWDRVLGYTITIFGKSPQACQKYREARLRYLRKSGN